MSAWVGGTSLSATRDITVLTARVAWGVFCIATFFFPTSFREALGSLLVKHPSSRGNRLSSQSLLSELQHPIHSRLHSQLICTIVIWSVLGLSTFAVKRRSWMG
jgi:hypothetical protein